MKTKVVYLINEISDGGAETLVKDYALNLDKNLYDVFIITESECAHDSANYKILQNNKIKIYSALSSYNETFRSKLYYIIKCKLLSLIPYHFIKKFQTWYIKRSLRKIKPQIIHAHMQVLKHLVPIAQELDQVKLFYTCHSLPVRYFNQKECLDEFLAAKFLISNNNLTLIGLHEEMREELNSIFKIDSTKTLRNCVNLNRFYSVLNKKEKKTIRRQENIPQDAFVIGHVGRFIWIKNHNFIIEIFKKLHQKNNKAFLLLVGAGDTSEITQKLSSYKLDGCYKILSNRTDVPELLLCMDTFLFPSYFEGLPIACIEAQAMGLRCLISQTITKDVFFSQMAIPANIEDSADKWVEMILNKEYTGTYTNDIEKFNIKNVMKDLIRIYSSSTNFHQEN
ncbi:MULTISPECIES: glycosyltransferase [unclassified Fibrobacter]|uniref:glycosyltransferase n=1 Tax=unclassified Fibrobacter TaxID=2634177 RepID=UPI000D6CECA8|nr:MULTISPECIES: glycosyltransferase [unclassified Fibrobacter]PWJ63063.1 glycosyltransferase involved in cell wall biosynthesis [Fibrobacter sp. UWR4]PZW68234.1 glycosyltransferase involved in cell wall biosynthesis [Fibrobacter sp. UWR1]